MVRARIIARERDEDTDAFSVLDIIEVPVPKDVKAIKKMLGETLTRFFLAAHEKHSDIYDIDIQFLRDKKDDPT